MKISQEAKDKIIKIILKDLDKHATGYAKKLREMSDIEFMEEVREKLKDV